MALEMRRDLMVSSSFSYKNSVILLCSILEKGGLKMKNTKDTKHYGSFFCFDQFKKERRKR